LVAALTACNTGAARDRNARTTETHNAGAVVQGARSRSTHDWTRFGWDAGRSRASQDPTGVDASNVASLVRQAVTLDGTVDASAIYLNGVPVGGRVHDAIFVTTTYGKTIAV